jgi:NADPH:quinone reductase-like Zn-dependent oxidoreductase
VQAVVLRQTGGPEVLALEELDDPEPDADQVLLDVRAISVNPIEWKYRSGRIPRSLPAILGSDVAGTVRVSRAAGFAPGDEVFGFAASGAYAERATTPAATLAARPSGLALEQAAALPVAGLTAWQALFDHADLQRGQTALIVGGAGGVGHLAVQLAKHSGATVIASGSARNREFVTALGADEYIDYTQENVATAVSDVDVAFDTVGGNASASLLDAVRSGGVLVSITGAPPEEAARERGVRTEVFSMSPDAHQLTQLGDLVIRGELRVEIAEVLALSEVRTAHEHSESGHTRGKIILKPGA